MVLRRHVPDAATARRPLLALAAGVLVAVMPSLAATASPLASGAETRSGATTAASADPLTPTALDALHWSHCPRHTGGLAGTGARCTALKVPLDYHKPHGKKVTLELSLLRHTSSAAAYRGVMLSNPGGPGAPGLALGPELAPAVPHNVGDDYDWLSWDPRGVGASKPSLHCQRNYFNAPRRSYDPTTSSLLHYWKKRSRKYAQACEQRYPHLLDHMTTRDSARDMESIRKALGAQKISYYGYSYGTYLGQVYSTLHPQHLERMVLDSNVDPRRVWYQANLNQDKAFDRNIHIYFKWVAKYHAVYHLGSTEHAVSNRYNHDLAKLTRHPDGRLGPDEWADAMEGAAYYQFEWEDLAQAWVAYAKKGHPGDMIHEYASADDPGNDNEFAVYNAVQCTDAHWPQSWSRWQKDNDAYAKAYPFLTWNNAWFNAPCLYWGAKAQHPVHIDGSATTSVLLIDQTKDAATPYSGSLEVRSRYPNASLIAEPGGTTHADSLDGDRCVNDIVAEYLKNGTRPTRQPGRTADATCQPPPKPDPAQGS